MPVLPIGVATALLVAAALATFALAAKKDNSIRFANEQVLRSLDPYFNS